MPFGTNDTFLDLAPEHLYYHVTDMSANGGLGKVTQKKQIAVMDTLARASVKAVQHANGEDWWVIVPKSHTNCYFLTLVNAQGTQPFVQFYISALAPDNKIYISGTSSHKFLHVIHSPDSLGLACNVEQRGLALPAYNYATIPNFPHYRTASSECIPVTTQSVLDSDRAKV